MITAGVSVYVQRFASLFTGPALAIGEWLRLLQVLFPEIQRRYAEAAALGRDFYDSQRRLHHPELPRNERLRSELQWEWFVRNMEPARKGMSQADSPRAAVNKLTLAAVREVEMAGRRQIIGAVKNDFDLEKFNETAGRSSDYRPQERRPVRGWARVATGRETCAWCLMLISRGPEYLSADSGGLHLDTETVVDLWNEAGRDLAKFREETKEHIEEWHAGCDCLVVPVFDVENWPGKAAQERATQLWIDAGHEADRLIASGEARSKNTNKETLNALRRRLARGEFAMSDYALAA
ncbi:capsid maturation protease [Mycobacterium phage AN9]|nr:capsid maturation protease [Mycobacterium phage ANI8]QJD52572.1 capsid maturation protease [Mycobacterium phage AN9]BBC43573.1 putative capsid maturation protease [Mycobacterium phage C3]